MGVRRDLYVLRVLGLIGSAPYHFLQLIAAILAAVSGKPRRRRSRSGW